MFSVYLMVIGYYLEHGRNRLKLQSNDIFNIIIHVHQDIHSQRLISILDSQLNDLIKHFKMNRDLFNIIYRTDNGWYKCDHFDYSNTHLLVSLSQCAGLDQELEPGAIITPDHFIPYDIDSNTINISQEYSVNNDIINCLANILKSNYHLYAIKYINQHYKSSNLSKNGKHFSIYLTENNFNIKKILQVNKLWNPKNKNELVTCL